MQGLHRLEHAEVALGYATTWRARNQKAIQVLKTVQGTDGAAALAACG